MSGVNATTIQISKVTRDKLRRYLSKAETYDAGLNRLLLIASANEEETA